jgi:ketosteroid isomerase-like protein
MSAPAEVQRRYPHVVLVVLYVACLLFGGGVIVFTCLAASREDPPPQAAIRQVLDDQAAAWNRGDLPGFMVGYWNSPELSFYSGKKKERGWQETFKRYQGRYQGEGKEMGKLTFSDLEIQLTGPETAIVRGRYKLVKSTETPEGLFTLVVKRFREGWRIVHDHTSEECPKAADKRD